MTTSEQIFVTQLGINDPNFELVQPVGSIK